MTYLTAVDLTREAIARSAFDVARCKRNIAAVHAWVLLSV